MEALKPSSFINDLYDDVKKIRAMKRTPRKSKIDKFRNEILILNEAGVSYRKIADWLKTSHDIDINESTVRRRVSLHWSNRK